MILVIGAGLAGCIAALRAAKEGSNVIIVKGDKEGASSWAQGGIVQPLKEDVDEFHKDLFESGSKINNVSAVNAIMEDGSRLIDEWLIKTSGVKFDENLALEAAHSKPRILHIKDHTGTKIMEKLEEQIHSSPKIKVINGMLIDFLLSNRHDKRQQSIYKPSICTGAYIFDSDTRNVVPIVSSATILASGGFSALYEHSTGSRSLTGSGVAAAHRAGARTMHLHYVQFHPTALYLSRGRRHLLSEALRGAGAKLLNTREESFVNELAPRDIVARAIHKEIIETNSSHVWLDCRHINDFEMQFPSIHSMLLKNKINPADDLIPVVPAAHYTLGGVWTDVRGATSVDGLYAAGEVACTGLHGANRLASTSLLEALVFGDRAAKAATTHTKDLDFEAIEWSYGKESVDSALLQQDWQLLRKTMWNYVGLTRNKSRLKRAERILSDLRTDIEDFYSRAQLSESLISLRQAVLVATMVLYAALKDEASLGTHFRED